MGDRVSFLLFSGLRTSCWGACKVKGERVYCGNACAGCSLAGSRGALAHAGSGVSWSAGNLLSSYCLQRTSYVPAASPSIPPTRSYQPQVADPLLLPQPLMRIDGKPYNPNARGGARNAPSIIRDGGQRAQSTPARTNGSTGASAASSSTSIETIRLFLTSRYNAQDKLLNMENMASDTILNSAGVLAPGQVGAARDISPVIWKLASQMFPDVGTSVRRRSAKD